MDQLEQAVVNAFHILYYYGRTWNKGYTVWMGIPCLQCPFDMWQLQHIIQETWPDLIIETGSAVGGSALFYANMYDLMANRLDLKKHKDWSNSGQIVSIDTQEVMKPTVKHPRITFLKGSSTDPKIVEKIKSKIDTQRVMVILDSDHRAEHVLEELKIYSALVTPGCYLVVMDTNLGGNPIWNGAVPGPGPMAAVREFMAGNEEFEIDEEREDFYMTFSPSGWLRKREKEDGTIQRNPRTVRRKRRAAQRVPSHGSERPS